MRDGFAFADEAIPGVRWDAKYATWDNFTGRPVDGYLANRIVGTTELCDALAEVRDEVATLGLGLLLWDAYRPQRAVDSFVHWSRQPEDGITKARHYPHIDRADIVGKGYVATRSAHSRGAAVDLTLYRLATGELLGMGGGYDLMDVVSHHGADGITAAEARNRQTLRSVMAACGFDSYEREWWHYTLRDEPYPDTYFDFPVADALLHV